MGKRFCKIKVDDFWKFDNEHTKNARDIIL